MFVAWLISNLFADVVINFAIPVELSGRTSKQLVDVLSGMSIISCTLRGAEDKGRDNISEMWF